MCSCRLVAHPMILPRHALPVALLFVALLGCKSKTEVDPRATVPEGCPIRGESINLTTPSGVLHVKDLRFFTAIGENPLATAPEGMVFAVVRYSFTPLDALLEPEGEAGEPVLQQLAAISGEEQEEAAKSPAEAGGQEKPDVKVREPGQGSGAPTPNKAAEGKGLTSELKGPPSTPGDGEAAVATPKSELKGLPSTPGDGEAAVAAPKDAVQGEGPVPQPPPKPDLKLLGEGGEEFSLSEEGLEAYSAMVALDIEHQPLPTEHVAIWLVPPDKAKGGLFIHTGNSNPDGTPARFCLGKHIVTVD